MFCSVEGPQDRLHPALRAALCSTACPFCHPGTRLTVPATCPPHPMIRRGSHPLTLMPTPTPSPLPRNKLPALGDLANLHDSHAEAHKTGGLERGQKEVMMALPPSLPPFFLLLSFCAFLLLSPAPCFPLSTGELWNNLRLVGFFYTF